MKKPRKRRPSLRRLRRELVTARNEIANLQRIIQVWESQKNTNWRERALSAENKVMALTTDMAHLLRRSLDQL